MTKCTREDQDTGEIAPQDRAREKKKKIDKVNKIRYRNMTDCTHKKKKKHFNPFTVRQMFFFNTYNFLEAIFVLSQVRYFYSGTLDML